MKNILCIHLHNWPITRALRKRKSAAPAPDHPARPHPLVLLQTIANRQLVVACCDDARALGIKPNLTLAQAHALCATIDHETWRPDLDQKSREALARYLVRFTPTVALETRDIAEDDRTPSHTSLFLDLTGCEHLYGGLSPMLRKIAETLFRLRIPATLAVAETPAAAFALTHLPPRKDQRNTTGVRTLIARSLPALAQAPIAGLRLPPDVVESLHHLGIETVGQLRALPRKALPARFGRQILLRLDQLTGQIPEPLTPLGVLGILEARRDFDGSIADPQILELIFKELLKTLLLQLERRGQGIRELEVSLERQDIGDKSPPQQFALHISRPSRDLRAILGLFRCAFDQLVNLAQNKRPAAYSLNFDAGFTAMRLHVQKAQDLPHQQIELNQQDRPQRQTAWQNTLDLIRTRLGETAIQQAELEQSYLPERAFRLKPAEVEKPAETPPDLTGERPLVLFSPPQEINVMVAPSHDSDGPPLSFSVHGTLHRLTHAAGPERVAGQWWEGHFKTRDYFDVADDSGARYWLFRVQETGKWYLHGNFA